MTLGEEFVMLFSASPWPLILLFVGIILIIIDSFDAGFDIPGILGLVSIIGALIIHMVNGGSWLMFFLLALFAVIVIFVSVLLVFRSADKGWLSRTALFDKTPAVPYDRTEGTPDYTALDGKTGEAVTALRPVGKIKIDGELYDAVCEECFVDSGTVIEVVEIEGCRIVVRASDNFVKKTNI